MIEITAAELILPLSERHGVSAALAISLLAVAMIVELFRVAIRRKMTVETIALRLSDLRATFPVETPERMRLQVRATRILRALVEICFSNQRLHVHQSIRITVACHKISRCLLGLATQTMAVLAQAARHRPPLTSLHLILEGQKFPNAVVQHSRVVEVLDTHLGFEYKCATRIQRLESGERGGMDPGRGLERAQARLVQNAVEGDDNIGMDEAVAFDVVFRDEAARSG